MGISLKVNVTARLEFEPSYFEAAAQHFNQYDTETSLWKSGLCIRLLNVLDGNTWNLEIIGWLVVWFYGIWALSGHLMPNQDILIKKTLVWFYGISTIVEYLMSNPFLTDKKFYFKQFSLIYGHSLNSDPVGLDSRIHQLLLFSGVRNPPKKCPGYDTK